MSKRTGKVTTFIGHRHLLPCYPIAPLLSGRRVESAPKTMEVAPTGVRFSAMRHLLPFCFATLLALNPAAGQSPTAAPKPAAPKMDYVGQIAAPLKPSRVITYKQVNGRELHLHVMQPEGWTRADKRACYITIHGGGWTGGAPQRMYPFASHYAGLGLVGISIEYRLFNAQQNVTVFDCVKDARSAVRYVRAHASELGVDPQKIIVSGGSAGGHLAAATALFNGVNEAGEDTTVSTVPNALVLLFPVIDTSKEGYGNAKAGDRWQEISPLHQVRSGLPPTLTFHGTGDTVTPFKGAQQFHEAMLKAGNQSELVVNEGGVHGYLMRTQALYDECLKKSDAFLRSKGFIAAHAP